MRPGEWRMSASEGEEGHPTQNTNCLRSFLSFAVCVLACVAILLIVLFVREVLLLLFAASCSLGIAVGASAFGRQSGSLEILAAHHTSQTEKRLPFLWPGLVVSSPFKSSRRYRGVVAVFEFRVHASPNILTFSEFLYRSQLHTLVLRI